MSNSTNPNDFGDFDDISLFSGLQQDQEEYRDQQQDRENRAPVSYLDEGSYWLRLYPEIRAEEDGSRRLHVVRRFWSYTGLAKGVRRLPAPKDPNDPVRQEVMRLKDANYPEAWKFMASEEGLIKAQIYRSTLPKDHKYIKLNTPMFIVLRRKQLTALSTFLADLSPEQLQRILDPRKPGTIIKASYTKGAGGSASFGFDLDEAELMPLPAEFPSLFEALINDKTEPANDEELSKIRKSISAVLAMRSNIVNPEDDSGAPPVSRREEERKSEAKSAVQEALKSSSSPKTDSQPKSQPIVEKQEETKKAEPAAADTAGHECPGQAEDPELAFGKHNGQHEACILCPFEAECQSASKG